MIRPLVIETARKPARIAAVRVHDPYRGRAARFGAAENDVVAIRGGACPKIPHRRVAERKTSDSAVAGIEPAYLCSTARLLWFERAVEVVGIQTVRLIAPWDRRVRKAARKKNL